MVCFLLCRLSNIFFFHWLSVFPKAELRFPTLFVVLPLLLWIFIDGSRICFAFYKILLEEWWEQNWWRFEMLWNVSNTLGESSRVILNTTPINIISPIFFHVYCAENGTGILKIQNPSRLVRLRTINFWQNLWILSDPVPLVLFRQGLLQWDIGLEI